MIADGGAAHMAEIIRCVREKNQGCTIEVLTSDFNGNFSAMDLVLDQKPEVFNHNVETVRAMTRASV
jgi:lipoic acid synthetase